MNFLTMGLQLLTRLPLEKFFFSKSSSSQGEQDAFYRKLEQEYQQRQSKKYQPVLESTEIPSHGGSHLTTQETVAYQRRELGKALILLEKHLQQKCKISGKACDCCEKHPLEIEALAQETRGMESDPIYDELVTWTRKLGPITTEQASASGDYDEQYPNLAIEARKFRKRLMGTVDLGALMTPEQQAQVSEDLRKILKEGTKIERGRKEGMQPERLDLQAGSLEAPGGTEHPAGERELSTVVSGSEATGGEDSGEPDAPRGSGPGES